MLADALHSTFPSAVASLGYLYVPLVEQFPCLHFALFILSSRLQPTRRQDVELLGGRDSNLSLPSAAVHSPTHATISCTSAAAL